MATINAWCMYVSTVGFILGETFLLGWLRQRCGDWCRGHRKAGNGSHLHRPLLAAEDTNADDSDRNEYRPEK